VTTNRFGCPPQLPAAAAGQRARESPGPGGRPAALMKPALRPPWAGLLGPGRTFCAGACRRAAPLLMLPVWLSAPGCFPPGWLPPGWASARRPSAPGRPPENWLLAAAGNPGSGLARERDPCGWPYDFPRADPERQAAPAPAAARPSRAGRPAKRTSPSRPWAPLLIAAPPAVFTWQASVGSRISLTFRVTALGCSRIPSRASPAQIRLPPVRGLGHAARASVFSPCIAVYTQEQTAYLQKRFAGGSRVPSAPACKAAKLGERNVYCIDVLHQVSPR